jgi:hypothetical protein
MKEKIKKFWKEHKEEILIGTTIIGGTVVGVILTKKLYKACRMNILKELNLEGKSTISWTPRDSFMNLERVKEILDLNANNSSSFAIFREGPKPEDYVCILLSKDVVVV